MSNITWEKIFRDIENKTESKKDYLLPRKNIKLSEENGHIKGNSSKLINDKKTIINKSNTKKENTKIDFSLSDEISGQFFKKLNMPTRYFKKLLKKRQFDLIKDHVDYNKLKRNPDGSLLIRTIKKDDKRFIRGVLTDRYNILDDENLYKIVKNILDKKINYNIIDYKKTFKYSSLRITFPDLKKDLNKDKEKGDILKAGLLVVNSEVGFNKLNINPLVYRVVCSNGLTVWQKKHEDKKLYSKKHIGLEKREMRKFAEVAVLSSIKEAKRNMDLLEESKNIEIDNSEAKIENYLRSNRINKSIIDNVITELNSTWFNNNSLYSLINSMTSVARNLDIEKRIDLEKKASKFLKNNIAA